MASAAGLQDIPGAVGIDLSPEMLAAGGAHNVIAGDVRAMPFASGSFDMVWCRLVLGYIPDPAVAYRNWRGFACRADMSSRQTFIPMRLRPAIGGVLPTRQEPCMRSSTMCIAIMYDSPRRQG